MARPELTISEGHTETAKGKLLKLNCKKNYIQDETALLKLPN